MDDPYDVLGVDRDADPRTVKRAYKGLVREHHPDAGGSAERFEAVRRAYDAIRLDEVGESAGSRTRGADASAGSARAGDPRTVGRSAGASVTDLFPAFETPLDTDRLREVLPGGCFLGGNSLWLALVALREVDVADVVFRHQTEDADTRRTVAVFHAYNPGTEGREWNGWTRTTFHGTDGAAYDRSDLQMNPYDPKDRFPTHLTPQFAEIPPGEARNGLLVVEDLPDGVDLDRVVYEQSRPGDHRGAESFAFDLDAEARAALARADWLDT